MQVGKFGIMKYNTRNGIKAYTKFIDGFILSFYIQFKSNDGIY